MGAIGPGTGLIDFTPIDSMPRTPRCLPQEHSFHITLRCNSRQFLSAKRIRRDVLLIAATQSAYASATPRALAANRPAISLLECTALE
jgi:hypothetical protein